ncbi:hypothetical protein [Timonella senegalensis]|uniref:hypothetical protein n=1 Tax=Timonella senegalensis TaxID=1465825 RepID=UPI000685A28E|nr:hypothetical protein [Timonella senegalensis]
MTSSLKSLSPQALLDSALRKATTIPSATIKAHVDSLRRKNPTATPEQIVDILSSEFKLFLQGSGGAVGASAALPGVGTTTALVLTSADLAAFFAAASAYSLAVAEVHGLETQDVERRTALLLASVLGDSGAKTVASLGARPSAAWGKTLLTAMPKSTIKQVNSVLSSRFIKRQLVKHGGVAMGRVIPFGIGAVVGIVGGRALAHTVIHQTTRAFGAAPASFASPLTSVIESQPISDDSPDIPPQVADR